MICLNCGGAPEPGDDFCPDCGAVLDGQELIDGDRMTGADLVAFRKRLRQRYDDREVAADIPTGIRTIGARTP